MDHEKFKTSVGFVLLLKRGKSHLDRWVRAAFVAGAVDEAVAVAVVAVGVDDAAVVAGPDD